jgi:hypothetical protein
MEIRIKNIKDKKLSKAMLDLLNMTAKKHNLIIEVFDDN